MKDKRFHRGCFPCSKCKKIIRPVASNTISTMAFIIS
ncbi:LIM domain-containing protein [Mucilaginibacter sp. UR6-1]